MNDAQAKNAMEILVRLVAAEMGLNVLEVKIAERKVSA